MLVRFFLLVKHLNWSSCSSPSYHCSSNCYFHILVNILWFRPSHSACCFHVPSNHVHGPVSRGSFLFISHLYLQCPCPLLLQFVATCFPCRVSRIIYHIVMITFPPYVLPIPSALYSFCIYITVIAFARSSFIPIVFIFSCHAYLTVLLYPPYLLTETFISSKPAVTHVATYSILFLFGSLVV